MHAALVGMDASVCTIYCFFYFWFDLLIMCKERGRWLVLYVCDLELFTFLAGITTLLSTLAFVDRFRHVAFQH